MTEQACTSEAIRAHLDSLAKPPGSLGKLEGLAAELCGIQDTLQPVASPRQLVLFAGDHGVVAEGVTAWPSAVTGLMVKTIASGGAACNALAASTNTALRLIDVGGMGEPLPDDEIHSNRRVREGTRNLLKEPALTVEEFRAAWRVGVEAAQDAMANGAPVLAAGEMGIGNTTAASCLTALLTGAATSDVVGCGAGADDAILDRKHEVIEAATMRASKMLAANAEEAMASVAGLEIAAMAGFFDEGARQGRVIVLDGFIATAAALVAARQRPAVTANLIAAHRSVEPGHGCALDYLGLVPWLDGWNLRLGEGTGALLLMPLLDAAAALTRMHTLKQIGAVPE